MGEQERIGSALEDEVTFMALKYHYGSCLTDSDGFAIDLSQAGHDFKFPADQSDDIVEYGCAACVQNGDDVSIDLPHAA
jgi:hypothetical protein